MFRIITAAKYRRGDPLCIDITVNMHLSSQDISSADVLHPRNIKKRYRMTDTELEVYSNFIETVASCIVSRGFIIEGEYQSKKSYSYYLPFRDPDNDALYRFKIRVADHPTKGKVRPIGKHGQWIQIITSIVVGRTKEFTRYKPALDAIIEICDNLKAGDFEAVQGIYDMRKGINDDESDDI